MMDLFTPFVSADYCNYFYVLMVANFVLMVLGLVSMGVKMLFRSNKGVKLIEVVASISMVVMHGLMYFLCRLFYSMCVGSVKTAAVGAASPAGAAGSGSSAFAASMALGGGPNDHWE